MKEYTTAMAAGILLLHTLPLYAKDSDRMMKPPVMDRCAEARYEIGGNPGDYISAITANWLLVAPEANPAMLQIYRDRDRTPYRNLLPWSGEFAGKYLTSAVQIYRITHDADLLNRLKRFVHDLMVCQAEDGYLGPYPLSSRLTGEAVNIVDDMYKGKTWDLWNHYHIMLGLLLWHETTGDQNALHCARKIGDMICDKFLGAQAGNRIVDTGSTEMNLAPIHAMCLLYRATGTARYLDMAKQIVEEFEAVGPNGLLAGDYLRASLAGKAYYQMTMHRWEGLHTIMGLVELYWITREEKYKNAFEQIWWSIVESDRHNNGGFSSGERAQGNPYNPGAIETCGTIVWIALSVEMLKLTGNSIVADEIELSSMNSVVGLHSPTGRWVTYDTPMDGLRRSATWWLGFQSREGSPELSCCSVNGARGFGMISDWAIMRSRDGGVVLNYFGPSTIEVKLKSGNKLKLKQTTDYPVNGRIALEVSPAKAETFALSLRIPYWSEDTSVKVNGKTVGSVVPGKYLMLNRVWKPKDKVEIDLDMSLHYWVGEKECEGKTSIYRGPILLTYDRCYNDLEPDSIPSLDAKSANYRPAKAMQHQRQPVVLLEFTAIDGRKLRLCDFGSAGYAGTPYKSWLNVDNAPKVEYSKSNPLRSGRI